MRRVTKKAAPADLDGPTSKGGIETAAAIAFYKVAANKDESFTFKAYGMDPVKNTLNEMFLFKCAYCETYYGATQPVDVEHYRPKAGYVADDKVQKPGYYWLAATWSNLLPSCTDCNRPRRQQSASNAPRVAGKANQFPIADEKKRAKKPGKETSEGRLLLHPILDHPERHLKFNEDGSVQPLTPSGAASKKGEASIEVYALWRDGLARARKARAVEIRVQMNRIERLARQLQQRPNDAFIKDMLRDEIAQLEDFRKPEQPYSVMADQMITAFKATLIT